MSYQFIDQNFYIWPCKRSPSLRTEKIVDKNNKMIATGFVSELLIAQWSIEQWTTLNRPSSKFFLRLQVFFFYNTKTMLLQIVETLEVSTTAQSGFIKSTDHRRFTHWHTDQSTHRPNNNGPTDKNMFKKLENMKTFYRMQTQLEKWKTTLRPIIYLNRIKVFDRMDNIYLYNFEHLFAKGKDELTVYF